jgi:hypothetical protein
MLRYTDKDKHTFLSPYWCKKLVDAGIDMSDATYVLAKNDGTTYVTRKDEAEGLCKPEAVWEITPTYTLPDLIYKFNEYPWVKEDGKDKQWGPIGFLKDAPFYIWTYYPNHDTNGKIIEEIKKILSAGLLSDGEKIDHIVEAMDQKKYEDEFPTYNGKHYIECMAETPIEAAARMLIVCKDAGIRIVGGANQKYDETVIG